MLLKLTGIGALLVGSCHQNVKNSQLEELYSREKEKRYKKTEHKLNVG